MDNDNENKSMSSYSNPADSPSMATVIIASPVVENYKLAISVQNSLKQYQPVGEFESIFEISQDLHIFKGTLPSTDEYNSKFKFVYVNSEDQDKIEHESKTMIRKQESKTNSWIFGFFELSSKISYKLTDLSILPLNKNGKFKKSVKELNETKIRKQIASEFFGILFKQICDEVLSGIHYYIYLLFEIKF